jgi:four helix bundle protein
VQRFQGRIALADQIRKAASSEALNIGEANSSERGNRRLRFVTAAGSPSETRSAALRVACQWGYVSASEAEDAQALIRRILNMLWRLIG